MESTKHFEPDPLFKKHWNLIIESWLEGKIKLDGKPCGLAIVCERKYGPVVAYKQELEIAG
jgi:hypothetical protein